MEAALAMAGAREERLRLALGSSLIASRTLNDAPGDAGSELNFLRRAVTSTKGAPHLTQEASDGEP